MRTKGLYLRLPNYGELEQPMSDGGFILPPGIPEEMAEHIRNVHTRIEMTRLDYQNRVRELLTHLSPEHLVTLREMFHTTMESDSSAPYLQGQISALLIYVHNVCVSCGEVHEGDHLISGLTEKPSSSEEQMELPFDQAVTVDLGTLLESGSSAPVEALENQMREYNMRYPNEGEVVAGPDERPVICIGCGTLYQSLEDRMLRKPGIPGCEGCIQKQKWG